MLSGGGMSSQHFIGYLRVSTQRQGATGLGIEAQRATVEAYAKSAGRHLAQEFVEVESGGKSDRDRPQLAAAMERCKNTGATLIFAKLDRLARDTRLVLNIADSGVPVVFCDFPEIPEGSSGRFVLTMLASVAEFERRRVSERTKSALAAAKRRGVILGATGSANLQRDIAARKAASQVFADRLSIVFAGFASQKLTQRQIASELNKLGIKTAKGKDWSLMQVQRVLKQLAAGHRGATDCRPRTSSMNCETLISHAC